MTRLKTLGLVFFIGLIGMVTLGAQAPRPKTEDRFTSETFRGLTLRSIGPAVTSGRVAAFAVNPQDRSQYYVAVASGGVWKTVNSGTTWTPVFDDQASYSIGAIALDPKDPSVVWVGTGENNNQRSVSYGDGVYRSENGGKSWKNVGLKTSEHIARILIDPRDSRVVYVAAQGPLWTAGGERGLYKTTDAGATWKKLFETSEHTGVVDVAMDPRSPDVLYAAGHQRRRHVWTMIHGGPESALYKTTDAGATWTKLTSGLPSEDLGRIGLAVSPANPDVVYALVEAANDKGGIFRSTDRGATWDKRNGFSAAPFYYGQIVADPKDVDRIYVPNTFMMVSDDGGKTLRRLGEKSKHVDNHALWIDPSNTSYYLVGCDGGVYESFDRGENWHFKPNLPVTQFYDVTVDNSLPFYNVYGGTQDNYSLGGPARTRSASGIVNSDWFVTQGGDGFQSRVDPEDPNIVYAEMQYGGLVRFDRRTGERMGIQPQEGRGEPAFRWNWDSPLIISPHASRRLYFAANKLFRSDDRGQTWKAVSGELSRGLDYNTLPVMGKIWGPEAIGRHDGTSFYGNATALAESPKAAGLIYVGTDDGVLNITDSGGAEWGRIESFAGVPERTYLSRLLASEHDVNTVYATFDNHKNGDFKPYVSKSTNRGRTFTSLASNLPANGPVLAIAEDPVNPQLLFLGTEFGLFFTVDGGAKWVQLKGGLPTVAVRDLAIQKRETDLVLATFGRGFYVLDDYSALRELKPETLEQEGVVFKARPALLYVESQPLGGRGKSFQGESFFMASNPPYGATFTYYLKEGLKSRKESRRELERKGETKSYPSAADLRAEQEEDAPTVFLTISDASGRVVRKVTGSTAKGLHRTTWDLRFPPNGLARPASEDDGFSEGPRGPLVMPGEYVVQLSKRVDGVESSLGAPVGFSVVAEGQSTMKDEDRLKLTEFQQKVARLQSAVNGALELANDLKRRMERIEEALVLTPQAPARLTTDARAIEKRLDGIVDALRGDSLLRSLRENAPPSLTERVNRIVGDQRMAIQAPTQTHVEQYDIVAREFEPVLSNLRTLVEGDLATLEKALEAAGAPWTPGRLPDWKRN